MRDLSQFFICANAAKSFGPNDYSMQAVSPQFRFLGVARRDVRDRDIWSDDPDRTTRRFVPGVI